MSSPLQPSMRLLITLGSIALLARNNLTVANSTGRCEGTAETSAQIAGLLADHELVAWLEQMDRLAFLPVKR